MTTVRIHSGVHLGLSSLPAVCGMVCVCTCWSECAVDTSVNIPLVREPWPQLLFHIALEKGLWAMFDFIAVESNTPQPSVLLSGCLTL